MENTEPLSRIQIILKLNALSCLLFGALFVFIPESIIAFLSDTTLNKSDQMPQVVMVALGVILNLWGMLLIWVSNRSPVPKMMLLLAALGDFLWVAATVIVLLMQMWVTSSNGMAVAGLVAMLVGWFGWQQFQFYKSKQ